MAGRTEGNIQSPKKNTRSKKGGENVEKVVLHSDANCFYAILIISAVSTENERFISIASLL